MVTEAYLIPLKRKPTATKSWSNKLAGKEAKTFSKRIEEMCDMLVTRQLYMVVGHFHRKHANTTLVQVKQILKEE